MNGKGALRGAWSQPSPRAEMIKEITTLASADQIKRFSIPYSKPGHIDDEVVVTLALDSWVSGRDQDANMYASELLRRVTKHVMAHVRKNPGWQHLGGGAHTAIDDFCEEVVLSILSDSKVPCHAEVAFGDFVYKRCLDAAGKLYAKKHSAGKSLDEDVVEAIAQDGDSVDSLAQPKSPEQTLIEIEEALADERALEKIRRIVQEEMPEKPALAFSFRYFGGMKIESKKENEITVTKLMNVSEKTASKYINQAIEIIRQRFSHD